MLLRAAELLALWSLPAFLLLDLLVRARRFPVVRGWRVRALVVSGATYALSFAVALGWASLLGDRSLLPGARLGTLAGALAGIVAYELVHYAYHRLAHAWQPLWRWHQMHHSAESLDAFGAWYGHPIDTFFFTTWSSLVLFGVLGLSPAAGLLAGAFLSFNAMFQHANLRTPRWLGYLVQRPESHSIHHERGVHAFNYSDLPLWDIAFGTFRNPAAARQELGFWHGASARLGALLLGRDVTAPPPALADPARETEPVRQVA